jgi:hypothetical protein
MSKPRFLDFDLLVSRRALSRRAYRARLWRSPAGEAKGTLSWSPPRAEFETLLEKLNLPAAGGLRIRPRGAWGTTGAICDLVAEFDKAHAFNRLDVAVELGAMLFAFLFQGKLRDSLRESLESSRRKNAGLALRLHLSAAPELAALPWEYLYDPENRRFLVQADDVEVARILGRDPGRPQPLGAQVRILAIGANPFGDLDVAGDIGSLGTTPGSPSKLEVTLLTPPTLARLRDVLGERDFEILHFAGHGTFDPQGSGGALVFEEADGGPAPIPATTLASILQRHPSLQVVVLNACKGGQALPHVLAPGIAQALILHGVRTVVAMQAAISDRDAISFARGFYDEFAATRSLEHALACGRDAMTGTGAGWAIPCLFTCEGARVTSPRLWPWVIAVAASAFAGFALCHWPPKPCQTLAISYPADHAEVEDTETILGNSCRLPPGQDVWMVVYSPAEKLYYPHEFKADLFATGVWESTSTTIGGEQDGGKEFELIAVLADQNGGFRLAAATGGVRPLPAGVTPYQRITVIRRK